MNRIASVFVVVFVASTSIGLVACGGNAAGPSGDTAKTPVLPAGDPASGEKLYAELGCKGCHGGPGEKDTVGPNLFAITWDDHERAEARETILAGSPDHKPPMPSYKSKVDDAKIADILAHLATK